MVDITKTALNRVECLAVHGRMPESLVGSPVGTQLLEDHIESCLVCLADASSDAAIRGIVRSNDIEPQLPRNSFVDEVMAGIRSEPSSIAKRRLPSAKVSASAASAVVVAVVWTLRKRQRTLGAA